MIRCFLYQVPCILIVCITPKIFTITSQWYISQQYLFILYTLLHVSTFLCHHQGVLHLCLVNLHNCVFNSFNFKNLCTLARQKCKTPWLWIRNVETCSSIYYIKWYSWVIYCCDINCAFVGCNRNNTWSAVIYTYILGPQFLIFSLLESYRINKFMYTYTIPTRPSVILSPC